MAHVRTISHASETISHASETIFLIERTFAYKGDYTLWGWMQYCKYASFLVLYKSESITAKMGTSNLLPIGVMF